MNLDFGNVSTILFNNQQVGSIDINGVEAWRSQVLTPFYVQDTSGETNTLTIYQVSTNAPDITIEKSTDGSNWSTLGTTSGTPLTISVPANSRLYLRSTSKWSYGGSISNSDGNRISMTKSHLVGGNIMSLIKGSNFAKVAPLPLYALQAIFKDNTTLEDASELLLPAISAPEGCYASMFYGCTALTAAPKALQATTLYDGCYWSMFSGCTSLTTAPILPATTLAKQCYYNMFRSCTSLTTAPALPATTLARKCYQSMFADCTSLTSMPILPATTLANDCYYWMFRGCTSLQRTTQLSAPTLVDNCYYQMFAGCTNLSTIRCLAVDKTATNCLYEWVKDVSLTGTFYKKASVIWSTGVNRIPEGWTVVEV